MSSPRLFCSPRYSAVYIFSFVCYPAFSSSCSRDFSSALSSFRISPRIAPVLPSEPVCPPISAGISARSVPPPVHPEVVPVLPQFPSQAFYWYDQYCFHNNLTIYQFNNLTFSLENRTIPIRISFVSRTSP